MCENRTVYDELVADGTIIPAQEVPPPTVPMDYSWARVRILICLFSTAFGSHLEVPASNFMLF